MDVETIIKFVKAFCTVKLLLLDKKPFSPFHSIGLLILRRNAGCDNFQLVLLFPLIITGTMRRYYKDKFDKHLYIIKGGRFTEALQSGDK